MHASIKIHVPVEKTETCVSRARFLDRAGIFLSSVCVVHCLVMPLVLMILPLAVESVADHDAFHAWIFWPVLFIAVGVFYRGYRINRRASVLALGALGLSLLLAAHLLGHALDRPALEYSVTIVGSVCIIVAHLRNLRAIRHFSHHRGRVAGSPDTGPACSSCDHL